MCHLTDRFHSAVRALSGEGTLKQRLVTAYVEHLDAIAAEDVPDSIRVRFAALRKAMTAVAPTEKETTEQVSVRKMSPADAARYSRSIVNMFGELIVVKETGERIGAGDAARTAAFSRTATPVRVPTFLASNS